MAVLVGLLTEFYLLKKLPISHVEFDPSLLVFCVAPFIALASVIALYVIDRSFSIGKTIALFAVLSIPLLPILRQTYELNPRDDSGRYIRYAQYMIANKTLWGADPTMMTHIDHKSYASQPGYRYWDVCLLLAFGEPIRVMQFVNGFILLLVYLLLINVYINKFSAHPKELMVVMLLLLLSFPAGMKNALQNLSEWMTVAFFMLSFVSYVNKRYLLFAVLLALTVFLRQNLLLASSFFVAFLFLFDSISLKRKSLMLTVYVLVLLLPVYHNLYFDGALRFFVDIWDPNAYLIEGSKMELSNIDFNHLWINFKRNLGLMAVGSQDLALSLFIPGFVVYLIWHFFTRKSFYKLALLLFVFLHFFPLILFSTDIYYPRFQYVAFISVLLMFHLGTIRSTELSTS